MRPIAAKESNTTLLAWICVAAIAVITYFVFSPSLQNDFTNWDDNDYVVNNPLVVNNTVQLIKIFETPVSRHYHPLTILSLALNYQNGKLAPFGYHLVNVILHILNTILIFLFIFLLTRRNLLMASITALFFGFHPMHVESVSWVSGRKDVLYVFFFLSGLITYLRYSKTRKSTWYVFTFLLFILSCLSKEMAIVFPFVLLLIDYLRGLKWSSKQIIEKIPFFLFSIIIGIIQVKIEWDIAGSNIKAFTFFERLLFASYATVIYIIRLFIPFKLSAYYSYPDTSQNGIPVMFYLFPFIILGLLATLIYLFLKNQREIVFGLLFYFITVVLVLHFVAVPAGITPDRYSYLSYTGLLFIVSYLINKAWQSKNSILKLMKYPVMIVTIIGGISFSYQSYSRTKVWKNTESLWTDVINKYPNVPVAYYGRAVYYYNNNEADSAMSDLNKAIICDSTFADAYSNRGAIYLNEGRIDLAMSDFSRAIELNPTSSGGAYYNRGVLYMKTGKNDLSLSDLTKAIKLDSTFADAYCTRGTIYSEYGKNDLAMADYNKAIAFNPNLAKAYNNRGLLYLSAGKNDSALADFNNAVTLNNTSASYYYNRGLCYKTLYQYEKATNDFTKAVELNPSVASFWLNRSDVESKTGQNDLANADSLKAQQLQGK